MTLALTYSEIQREIGRYLSISENPMDWPSEDSTRVTDIIRRGARRFYFPENLIGQDGNPVTSHDWSFIQKELSLALTTGSTWTDLPTDFQKITERPTILGSNFPLEEISASVLYSLENSGSQSGPPQYYTIKILNSTPLYQIGLHPKPTGALTLNCWYLYCPEPPSALYAPVVPANHAETMLAAMILTADEIMNMESGATSAYFERFKTMLINSIAVDKAIGAENSNA